MFSLSLSLTSAFWPFDIFNGKVTGNVISDNTAVSDDPRCTDSDGGVFSGKAGTVTLKRFWGSSNFVDSCGEESKGKGSVLTEYYCDAGRLRYIVNDCEFGCNNGECLSPPEEEVSGGDFFSDDSTPIISGESLYAMSVEGAFDHYLSQTSAEEAWKEADGQFIWEELIIGGFVSPEESDEIIGSEKLGSSTITGNAVGDDDLKVDEYVPDPRPSITGHKSPQIPDYDTSRITKAEDLDDVDFVDLKTCTDREDYQTFLKDWAKRYGYDWQEMQELDCNRIAAGHVKQEAIKEMIDFAEKEAKYGADTAVMIIENNREIAEDMRYRGDTEFYLTAVYELGSIVPYGMIATGVRQTAVACTKASVRSALVKKTINQMCSSQKNNLDSLVSVVRQNTIDANDALRRLMDEARELEKIANQRANFIVRESGNVRSKKSIVESHDTSIRIDRDTIYQKLSGLGDGGEQGGKAISEYVSGLGKNIHSLKHQTSKSYEGYWNPETIGEFFLETKNLGKQASIGSGLIVGGVVAEAGRQEAKSYLYIDGILMGESGTDPQTFMYKKNEKAIRALVDYHIVWSKIAERLREAEKKNAQVILKAYEDRTALQRQGIKP